MLERLNMLRQKQSNRNILGIKQAMVSYYMISFLSKHLHGNIKTTTFKAYFIRSHFFQSTCTEVRKKLLKVILYDFNTESTYMEI